MEASATHTGSSDEDGWRSRPCPGEDALPGRPPRRAPASLAACGAGSIVGGERRMAVPVNWWSRSRGNSEGAHGTTPGGQACCTASSSPATADGGESRRPHSLAPRRGGYASLGAPCDPAAPASKSGSSGIYVNHSRRESASTLRGRLRRPLSLLLFLVTAFAFFAPADAQVPPFRNSPSPNTPHPGTKSPQPGLSPGCGCAHSHPLASLCTHLAHQDSEVHISRFFKGPFLPGSCPDRETSPCKSTV